MITIPQLRVAGATLRVKETPALPFDARACAILIPAATVD